MKTKNTKLRKINLDDFTFILEDDLEIVGLVCENNELISIKLKPNSFFYELVNSK